MRPEFQHGRGTVLTAKEEWDEMDEELFLFDLEQKAWESAIQDRAAPREPRKFGEWDSHALSLREKFQKSLSRLNTQ
jgi:hypothetical protein